jgi:hypothetical protein
MEVFKMREGGGATLEVVLLVKLMGTLGYTFTQEQAV